MKEEAMEMNRERNQRIREMQKEKIIEKHLGLKDKLHDYGKKKDSLI
jgi:hypothetical protein